MEDCGINNKNFFVVQIHLKEVIGLKPFIM